MGIFNDFCFLPMDFGTVIWSILIPKGHLEITWFKHYQRYWNLGSNSSFVQSYLILSWFYCEIKVHLFYFIMIFILMISWFDWKSFHIKSLKSLSSRLWSIWWIQQPQRKVGHLGTSHQVTNIACPKAWLSVRIPTRSTLSVHRNIWV